MKMFEKLYLKASVHNGTQVPATWDWNQKLLRTGQIKGNIWHFKEEIDKISLINIEYFLNILEISHITLYLAGSQQFLVPVPGSRVLSSVVYGGL